MGENYNNNQQKSKYGQGVLTGILITIIIFLIIFIVYDKVLSNDNSNNDNKNNNEQVTDNNIQQGENDEILSLTTEELDEKLKYLNFEKDANDNILLFQDFDSKAYNYDNYKINLNTNLFDNDTIKNKIAILIGNIKTESGNFVDSNGNTFLNDKIYVNYNDFSPIYEEIWQEKLDYSKVEQGKYYVYSIPSGVGLNNIQVKAKSITKENDTYIIKTYIGVLDSKINSTTYNYDNNYEGQLRFKKTKNYYQIESFIIKEIQ